MTRQLGGLVLKRRRRHVPRNAGLDGEDGDGDGHAFRRVARAAGLQLNTRPPATMRFVKNGGTADLLLIT
jgi:hypothetical protein